MKGKFWMLPIVLLLIASACSKESVVPEEKLPASIQSYISTHFPGDSILQVVKDREWANTSYEVILDGSTKLEFNKKNEIKSIESVTELPASVIPSKISAYVEEKYPDRFIRSWELDDNRQEVELDNGIELVFNLEGGFLRIDT
ncbi:PepSY-like domain-containing protein [Ravibacter arvi]|uniref:PepSY-like domain-containing protein n=1 Tax=Ravibacter arvi TaxID=2051041 RepID=A0ABP8LQT1_9BACT